MHAQRVRGPGDTRRRPRHDDHQFTGAAPAHLQEHPVEAFIVPAVSHTDDMVVQVDRALLEIGRATYGDRVVIVAGVPPGVPGTTNGMRVHKMGSSDKGRSGV